MSDNEKKPVFRTFAETVKRRLTGPGQRRRVGKPKGRRNRRKSK